MIQVWYFRVCYSYERASARKRQKSPIGIGLTAVFSQKKCRVEKIHFSIRLIYYYLGSTWKKMKFGTRNIVYLAI